MHPVPYAARRSTRPVPPPTSQRTHAKVCPALHFETLTLVSALQSLALCHPAVQRAQLARANRCESIVGLAFLTSIHPLDDFVARPPAPVTSRYVQGMLGAHERCAGGSPASAERRARRLSHRPRGSRIRVLTRVIYRAADARNVANATELSGTRGYSSLVRSSGFPS
jgi:hypothetical protein